MSKNKQYTCIDEALRDLPIFETPMPKNPILNDIQDPIWGKEKQNHFAKLLQIDGLSEEELNVLIAPWHRAMMLFKFWKQYHWPTAKKKAQKYLALNKRMEKEYEKDTSNLNEFTLLFSGIDFDKNKELALLSEKNKALSTIVDLDLSRGQPFDSFFFIRYAINSLFYIGTQIGLKPDGSPSSIHRFVQDITERDYEIIHQDYLDYKNIELAGTIPQSLMVSLTPEKLQVIQRQKERLEDKKLSHEAKFLNYFSEIGTPTVQFIFHPKKGNTSKTLRIIRLRRIKQRKTRILD